MPVISEIQDSSTGDSISVSNHSFSQSSPVAQLVEGGRRIKESPTAIHPNGTLVTVITVVFNGEQYLKDIPLRDERSYAVNPEASIFSEHKIEEYAVRSKALNNENQGDQAAFYFHKPKTA